MKTILIIDEKDNTVIELSKDGANIRTGNYGQEGYKRINLGNLEAIKEIKDWLNKNLD
jgi:hypothetical protein